MTAWDPRFFETSALFAPVAEGALLFAGFDAFPTPEQIDEVLSPRAGGMRFVRQAPKPRRAPAMRDPSSMYDARIVHEGVVPTRNGSWHDLMNALVWATFPRAKRALHTRQSRLVVPSAPGVSARRPRELDVLAMIDEGGVIAVAQSGLRANADEMALAEAVEAGDVEVLVFGHGIYEGLARGTATAMTVGGAVVLDAQAVATAGSIDAALHARLADETSFRGSGELVRVRLVTRRASQKT